MSPRPPIAQWTVEPLTRPGHPILPGYFGGRTIRHTIRRRGSGDWLLIYTLAGSGLYQFDGGEIETRPHEITLYRPGDYQNYQWSPQGRRWDLLYAHFHPRAEWLSWLEWPARAKGLMVLRLEERAIRRRVIACLRGMIRDFRGARLRRVAFSQHALEEALLWCDAANPRQGALRIDPRVARAMEFICRNPALPYSEAALVKTAGLSASRLRHLFRAQAGQSIRDFQERQRMEQARPLLTLSNQTIGEISAELGFANPFYFTLRFKKWSGESPRAFRRRTAGRNS
jgi:AraC family transcriptional regulator of arabinose operon